MKHKILALAAVCCARVGPVFAADTIKIGAVAPKTGAARRRRRSDAVA